jgi:hypothetical protein
MELLQEQLTASPLPRPGRLLGIAREAVLLALLFGAGLLFTGALVHHHDPQSAACCSNER